MNTLGWESLEAIRIRFGYFELAIRVSHALVQSLKHCYISNAPLFARWDKEFRSCFKERDLYVLPPPGSFKPIVFSELNPEVLIKKKTLEIELLLLSQAEEECLRAFCANKARAEEFNTGAFDAEKWRSVELTAADRSRIEETCQAHEKQHARCVELVEQFRHDYLGDVDAVVG